MKPFLIASVCALAILFAAPTVRAAAPPDADQDGLADVWETRLFRTDPVRADSDGDGFGDGVEVRNGFDPLNAVPGTRIVAGDADADGLTDALEVSFGTDPLGTDTDGDSYVDGTEVRQGYDPKDPAPKPLVKRLRIDLSEQRLYQEIDGVVVASFKISSGKPSTPTPVGTYKIETKTPRAWSGSAKLWMPYWLGFRGWTYGIHELPEWPGGKKEGQNHLGKPVSHGCVRLGIGAAKTIYEWAPIGAEVVIQK